jgi:MinD-like ATPase involved in chromosome partitioning or flagellar assembly
VILAEMLPGRGALALELGMTGSRGLVDLLGASKLSDITRDRLRESLTHHGSGLALLLASDRARDMHLISQNANYEAITSGLTDLARFVVLDLGAGLQPFTEKVLAHCDQILVVLEGNPNTIIITKSLIEELVAMGVNLHNLKPVLNNRIRSDTQLPSSQVQSKLNYELLTTLTPAPYLFVQATRLQTPAVLCQPESLTARQINKIVEYVAEREAMPR